MMKKELILYIDDEFLNLSLFEHNFGEKYNILTAENGIKGLELLDTFPNIRVIVCDMKMPLMNGIEFTKIAKEKYPDIKYFITTGYDVTKEIEDATSIGLILMYFRKPFNMAEISSAIEKSISTY